MFVADFFLTFPTNYREWDWRRRWMVIIWLLVESTLMTVECTRVKYLPTNQLSSSTLSLSEVSILVLVTAAQAPTNDWNLILKTTSPLLPAFPFLELWGQRGFNPLQLTIIFDVVFCCCSVFPCLCFCQSAILSWFCAVNDYESLTLMKPVFAWWWFDNICW